MVKIELDARETYLTFLAVKNQLNLISQYPDPLHEQHKVAYSNLLAVWAEAVNLANEPPVAPAEPLTKGKDRHLKA